MAQEAIDPRPGSVRHFEAADVGEVWRLMSDLATFEGYDDKFAVTIEDILDRGLGRDAQFRILVRDRDGGSGRLSGLAVIHFIPWTFDLSPDLVLKKLYVDPDMRGKGVGRDLFNAVIAAAREAGSRRIRWLVLPDNRPAQQFYRAHGGRRDDAWEPWCMDLA